MSQNPLAPAYLGLGSNLGDRAGNLLLALRGIVDSAFQVERLSSIYETQPLDFEEQPNFLNMVVELKVDQSTTPEQAMARLLRVEYALGRRREIARGPRTIDLDLLIWNSLRLESDFLTLPHPRLHLRRFVLEPLAELSPDLIHPRLNRTIEDLLENCEDQSRVRRWFP